MRATRRTACAALVVGLAGVPPVATGAEPAADPAPTTLLETTRVRLRSVRLRAEPTRTAAEGHCSTIGVDDLRVTVRREAVDASRLRIVREPQSITHVLLLDTSASIASDFDLVREAAAAYLGEIEPERDEGVVATFGNELILQGSLSSDRLALAESSRATWPGGYSALHDALVHVTRGLSRGPGRTAVVLLTDGIDTASLHDRDDVRRALRRRPDLSVFVVGVNVPSTSRARTASSRVFLYEIAGISRGRYFDVPPHADAMGEVVRRIRAMIDSEAILTVVDTDVDREPGRLRVRSREERCRVRIVDEADPPTARETDEGRVATSAGRRLPAPPHERFLRRFVIPKPLDVDSACVPDDADEARALAALWWTTVSDRGVHGCVLDVIQDIGELYDPWSSSWTEVNGFLAVKTRSFRFDLPPIQELPRSPLGAFEALAEVAYGVVDEDVDTAPRKRPPELHGRPFHDLPGVLSGRTWFDLRPRLAVTMALRDDYRAHAAARLRDEGERELERLRRRYRTLAPDAPAAMIDVAVESSPEGLRIARRIERPDPEDLARHLAAWLGDVPAAELFRRWEIARLDRVLAGTGEPTAYAELAPRWTALRRVLFAPSYARTLTLLTPVVDAGTGRLGFYRIVLPRAAWFLPRLKNHVDHRVWSGLPLDLIPDVPMGLAAVERALADDPGLADRLRASQARVRTLVYEPLTRPRKRNPRVGWRAARVRVTLSPCCAPGPVWEVVADCSFEPVDGTTPNPVIETVSVVERAASAAIPGVTFDGWSREPRDLADRGEHCRARAGTAASSPPGSGTGTRGP